MQEYDIGRTFRRAVALLRDGLTSVGLFLLLVTVLTQVVQVGLAAPMGEQLAGQMGGDDPGGMALAMLTMPLYWLGILAAMGLGAVGAAGTTFGYARLAAGQPATIKDCLAQGAALFLPTLLLTILWTLGVGLGFALLIVPGVFLVVLWSVVFPALIVDRAGVLGSFGRSRELTRGSRPAIFGTLVVMAIVVYLPALLIGVTSASGVEQSIALASGQLPVYILAVSTVYGWIASMIIYALIVSIYHELVEVAEGGSTQAISETFE